MFARETRSLEYDDGGILSVVGCESAEGKMNQTPIVELNIRLQNFLRNGS
jgi:hypothetical protein